MIRTASTLNPITADQEINLELVDKSFINVMMMTDNSVHTAIKYSIVPPIFASTPNNAARNISKKPTTHKTILTGIKRNRNADIKVPLLWVFALFLYVIMPQIA